MSLRPLEAGDRVRRGPDWSWGDQDVTPGNLGTVISPNTFLDQTQPWITVGWEGGSSHNYPYYEGDQGIELVDPVRLLPGDRVIHGPDWHRDEQDGGEDVLGTVLESSALTRLHVNVKWDNETNPNPYNYRYATGHRDLQYVGHNSVPVVGDGDGAVPPFNIGDQFRVQTPLPGQTLIDPSAILTVCEVFPDGTAVGKPCNDGPKAVLEPWMLKPALLKL